MDPETLILLAGAAIFAMVYFSQQQSNQDFSGFMAASGATEDDIVNSIVPVNDTDPSQFQSGDSSMTATIKSFADAIFNFEGGASGNLNVRNNNPGNLKAAPDEFTGSVTQRDDNGFVIFPTMDAGFAALNAQLSKTVNDMPNLTLTQFFARYLGQQNFLTPQATNQGNPFTYADTVAGKLGVSADQTLGQIFGGG